MGELIAFKPATDNVRLKAAPIDFGTIVFFTGVWQERLIEQGAKAKRVGCVSTKRSGKSRGKSGAGSRK